MPTRLDESHESRFGDLDACNIVMKGGITSGVVYPLMVVELARKHRFVGIGGTSAGAIAAALTAAAEKGRSEGGFEKIATVAEDLPNRLRGLFQPTPRHKPLFDVLMCLAAKQGGPQKALGIVAKLLAAYPFTAFLGTLPALLLLALGWSFGSPFLVLLTAFLALVVFMVAAFALRLKRIVATELPESDFGLCPGIRQPWATEDGLIDWLADRLDDVAGQPRDEATGATKPLTFGDLEGDDPERPAIDLRVFTTCLSTGRPHVMPWTFRTFLYRPDEMRTLFPERIVAWMEEHSAPVEDHPHLRTFPERKDLPVLVPVRMSLSFPLLFPTVPLWTRDFTLRDEEAKFQPRRVAFSDGGMCSNLPLQLFDHMWPKRPTFAITLDAFNASCHVESDGTERHVHVPQNARSGLLLPIEPIETLGGFVGRILNTMQNWQDRLQATLPGYRERIVYIYLNDDEGGLNLDMHPKAVAKLGARGREAGRALVTSFNWPAHRWTRVVSAIEALTDIVDALDEETIDFVRDRPDVGSRYRQTKAWRDGAAGALEALREIEAIKAGTLAPKDPPRPVPQLRMMPRP